MQLHSYLQAVELVFYHCEIQLSQLEEKCLAEEQLNSNSS